MPSGPRQRVAESFCVFCAHLKTASPQERSELNSSQSVLASFMRGDMSTNCPTQPRMRQLQPRIR